MAVNNEQNQYMYCIYLTVKDQTCESLQNEKMKIQPNHVAKTMNKIQFDQMFSTTTTKALSIIILYTMNKSALFTNDETPYSSIQQLIVMVLADLVL